MKKFENDEPNETTSIDDSLILIYEGDHELQCNACHGCGIVMACDYCPLVYHPQCATPKLMKQPEDYWACTQCLHDMATGNLNAIRERCNKFYRKHDQLQIISKGLMNTYLRQPPSQQKQ